MVQNTSRAPPGSLSGGRSTIAEYSQRSRGIMCVIAASSGALEARRFSSEAERHDLFRAQHLAERGGDDAQRPSMEIRAIHGVDAVGDDNDRIVATARRRRGSEHAGIWVDARDQHRV